jgi:hypothetical protein
MGKKMLFPDGRSKMSRNLKKESWGFIDFNKPKKKKKKMLILMKSQLLEVFFHGGQGYHF